MRVIALALVALAGLAAACAGPPPAEPVAAASDGPVRVSDAVAPYVYTGADAPGDPVGVMRATGVRMFTLAFVLSAGDCTPAWNGSQPLRGGPEEALIGRIRAAGGDVVPSFGGATGRKLEADCPDAASLAEAYQQVVDAYALTAVDVDIEQEAYDDPAVQQRTVDALGLLRSANPDVKIYVTFPSGQSGPDESLILRAAAGGLLVDAWTIMPFDFHGGADMARLTESAAEGLRATLSAAYGWPADKAYQHLGISTMNGATDVPGEVVSRADFTAITAYARQHRIGRLSFWSLDRDPGWDFTRALAAYTM